MRLIPYLLYILLIALYVLILRDVLAIAGVTLNLVAFLVMTVALYKGDIAALWFGLVAGIVAAAGAPSVIGWYGLVTAALGLGAHHAWERLNLESLYSKLLLVGGGTLVHSLVCLAIRVPDALLSYIAVDAVLGAVYTTALAAVFFLIKEGQLSYQKMKSVF